MDEQLLELRRSRMRRKPRGRKILTEVLEAFMVIFIFLGMLIFFTWVWLTDPAYAYPRYDAETTQMSEQEYDELTRIVNMESGTEDPIGQMAVAEVVLNRVESKKFPNSVHDVLSQKKQFTTWKHRSEAVVTQDQIDAIEAVITSEASVMDPYLPEGISSKQYMYFCTPGAYKRIGYRYMHNIIRIGDHVFGTT